MDETSFPDLLRKFLTHSVFKFFVLDYSSPEQ